MERDSLDYLPRVLVQAEPAEAVNREQKGSC